jgi:hypothetical protein
MARCLTPLFLLVLAGSPLAAQLSDATLQEMIQEADASPTVENLVQAATAARLMRDYELRGCGRIPRRDLECSRTCGQ